MRSVVVLAVLAVLLGVQSAQADPDPGQNFVYCATIHDPAADGTVTKVCVPDPR